jgi:hypothetical protein
MTNLIIVYLATVVPQSPHSALLQLVVPMVEQFKLLKRRKEYA